jgi:predicted glycoside hydrolase/deacetylase ChbG (UPF0249 family)
MCHPGHADDALIEGSTYAREREQEIAALCDPAVREMLAAEGIELIKFSDIA